MKSGSIQAANEFVVILQQTGHDNVAYDKPNTPEIYLKII